VSRTVGRRRGCSVDQGLRELDFVSHIDAFERAVRQIRIKMSVQDLSMASTEAPCAVTFRLNVARPDRRPLPPVLANKRVMSMPVS